MKLTKEQFEDIITVGEAKAAAENKKLTLQLNRETPELDEEIEEGKTFRSLGYILEFRPKPERVSRGLSEQIYQESEIIDYWDVKEKEELGWGTPETGSPIGFMPFIGDYHGLDDSYIIRFAGQKYASWEPFAKAFGITELVTFATKIPRALAVKLQRICEEEGETPSWRIRLLIQEYLTEKIKDRVRQVLFEG